MLLILYVISLLIFLVSLRIYTSFVLIDKRLRLKLFNEILKELSFKKESLDKEFKELNEKSKLYFEFFEALRELSLISEEKELFLKFEKILSKFYEFKEIRFFASKEEGLSDLEYFLIPEKNLGFKFLGIKGFKAQDTFFLKVLIKQFCVCLKRLRLYKAIEELAIYDSLTGVFSRAHLMERLKDEYFRSKKFNLNLGILMCDIDHFKKCNDTYGHLVGDVVLKEVARCIKDSIRSIDFVGRYGGEEFLVVLPEVEKNDLKLVAERILTAVRQKQIQAYDEILKVTISIGGANFPSDSQDLTELIEKADSNLYTAKRTGRDKAVI